MRNLIANPLVETSAGSLHGTGIQKHTIKGYIPLTTGKHGIRPIITKDKNGKKQLPLYTKASSMKTVVTKYHKR